MNALHQAILDHLEDGQLPCPEAFAIARQLDVEPLMVGQAANEANVRISRCQLGLFGYGPKAEGRHKIVQPLADVPADRASHILEHVDGGGITCAALWQVAERLGIRRLEASGAAEALGVRVSHCQLGCFPR